ncbi:glycosyltransferase family 87 protein [Micromonospora cathayae]|uniref:Glycosyltransferase family 87 protein n=1 Tax=Micromonospora cathayae TaxID=3028804 RepID=A0ABY7ZU91_9ACTN|nr:glycosyltransferase family 87 protein [Micromonospora sp. HUAS 3]WDZ85976.1 glycosyltransferase family 87 protein [Micromonospora sp. HUAS 3]
MTAARQPASPPPRGWATARHAWHRADTAAGGLPLDLGLYTVSALFAGITAVTSTLPPHRAWGAIAVFGYLAAAVLAAGQLAARRHRPDTPLGGTPARAAITALTWVTTTLLPLGWQAGQRADGRTDRAQEEVLVVEHSGARLVHDGTPYLGPDAIAALPPGEQLLGYTPYQPGMALFGLPRAALDTWWTDARLAFALVTAVVLALAVHVLRTRNATGPGRAPALDPALLHAGQPGPADRLEPALLRAVQAATVLPICALTLATGGDDLPVLALCLLALALAATGRPGPAGIAVGLAGALKLLAWPVALVLLCWAYTRRATGRFAAGAFGLPAVALLPALLVDRDALVENVLRFPLGQGLVTSPAQSPLPGHLIATGLPAGRAIATALLVVTGLAIAVRLLRLPPRTAATSAVICGYGLLAAIALMPATRFGYLLYPIALLVWAPALRIAETPVSSPDHRTETADRA